MAAPFDNTVTKDTVKGAAINEVQTRIAANENAVGLAGAEVVVENDGSQDRLITALDIGKAFASKGGTANHVARIPAGLATGFRVSFVSLDQNWVVHLDPSEKFLNNTATIGGADPKASTDATGVTLKLRLIDSTTNGKVWVITPHSLDDITLVGA